MITSNPIFRVGQLIQPMDNEELRAPVVSVRFNSEAGVHEYLLGIWFSEDELENAEGA